MVVNSRKAGGLFIKIAGCGMHVGVLASLAFSFYKEYMFSEMDPTICFCRDGSNNFRGKTKYLDF